MNKKLLIYALVGAIIGASLVLIGARLVGDQSADYGALGRNRFPNSGHITRYVKITDSPATSTAIQDSSLYVKGTSTFVGATAFTGLATFGSITNAGALTQSGSYTLSGAGTITGAFNVDAIGSGILTITNGGGGNTTSTAAVADICTNTTANWLATGVATLTFPGAVPLQADCLDTPGAYRDIKFRSTGVATSSITFAAGASSTIHTASSTGSSVIAGGNYAWLRFEHVTSTTSDATMVEISVFEPFK